MDISALRGTFHENKVIFQGRADVMIEFKLTKFSCVKGFLALKHTA